MLQLIFFSILFASIYAQAEINLIKGGNFSQPQFWTFSTQSILCYNSNSRGICPRNPNPWTDLPDYFIDTYFSFGYNKNYGSYTISQEIDIPKYASNFMFSIDIWSRIFNNSSNGQATLQIGFKGFDYKVYEITGKHDNFTYTTQIPDVNSGKQNFTMILTFGYKANIEVLGTNLVLKCSSDEPSKFNYWELATIVLGSILFLILIFHVAKYIYRRGRSKKATQYAPIIIN